MSALTPDQEPELPLSRIQEIQRLINAVFWPFVVIFGLKFLSGLAAFGFVAREDAGAPRTAGTVDLVLSVLLALAYVALAVGLTRACIALGRRRGLLIAWFVILPVLAIVISTVHTRLSLGGLAAAVGFLVVNALFASPAAIWLSVNRDLEERVEELSSLSSTAP